MPATAAAPVPLRLLVAALLPFGLGYFMSYLFRAVNAVVAPDLQSEIGLSAAELGLLTAAYLLAFAVCQLPLGIALDRFGPRRVQMVLLTVAAAGAVLFAIGSNVATLTIARALIGVGFAGGLMASFKSVVQWVPETRRALANAYVMSLGGLGLISATAPMEWAVALAGWRAVFVGLAAITIGVALMIAVIAPDRRPPSSGDTLRTQVAAIGVILSDRGFWGLAPLLAATAGAHIGIQTLWAGPWFRDVAGFDRITTANHLFVMAAAFFVGILVSGWVADRFISRGVNELDVMVGFLGLFLAAQLCIIFDVKPLRWWAWAAFGMSGQVAILAYPWLSRHFGAGRTGRSQTAMNLIIFGAAFLIQFAIGAMLDLFPSPPAGGHGAAAYQTSFGAVFALQVVALIWYLSQRARLLTPATVDTV